MKVNRANKVLYGLPVKITMDSSIKTVELVTIKNETKRMKIENFCDCMNEKKVEDTDSKRFVFKVENT